MIWDLRFTIYEMSPRRGGSRPALRDIFLDSGCLRCEASLPRERDFYLESVVGRLRPAPTMAL